MTRFLQSALTKKNSLAGCALLFPAVCGASEHALPVRADVLFRAGPLPVTNSMVTAWVVAAALVLVVRLAVWKPRLMPTRPQVVLEALVGGVLNLVSPIVGPKVSRAAFPLLIGLFAYILAQNWSGLLPGVGSVYWNGEPLVRPGNADLNSTLALALVATAAWFWFIMRHAGPAFVVRDLFGNKASKRDLPAAAYYALAPLFAAVGVIELISIVFRPVSLSFRLFGNVFGGESLIHAMSGMTRWGAWLLPLPFYFLELLIGLVQALVFTLLVSVYIGLICNHGGGEAPH